MASGRDTAGFAGNRGIAIEGRGIREILAQEFASTAAWRRDLARRYPEEPAHLHSVSALEQLADYVRSLPKDDVRLLALAALNRGLDFFSFGGEETRYLIDQYGFQGSPLPVTPDVCAVFLGQLVEAASNDDADRISRQDVPGAEWPRLGAGTSDDRLVPA